MYPIEMPIGTVLSQRALVNPDLEALVGPRRRFTFGEYELLANRIAHFLRDRGVKKGDRVAAFAENNVVFPLLMLGALKIGAICVPVNWGLNPEMLRWTVAHAEPSLILEDGGFEQQARSLGMDGIPVVRTSIHYDLDPEFERALYSYPAHPPEADVSPEDPACIVYTSGTTGRPKGAVISHKNLYASGLNYGFFSPVRDTGYRLLQVMPLFHISGVCAIGLQALCGFTYLFLPQFDPHALLQTIDRERAHSMFVVPGMLGFLLPLIYQSELTLSSLREIHTAGSPVPANLIREYENLGFKIIQEYGLTEYTGIVTMWHSGMGMDTCGTVGKAFLTQLRVLDPKTRQELPRGEIGELAVRGPMAFMGYWRDPEATRKAFHDGWLLTGDAAFIDERGFVHIVDRYKDVIYFSGGDTIFPSEVERVIREVPGVADAALIGAEHERWSEIPCAFIVPKPGSSITREEIFSHVHARLDRHKLMEIIFVRELPKNSVGKVNKPLLKTWYKELKASQTRK